MIYVGEKKGKNVMFRETVLAWEGEGSRLCQQGSFRCVGPDFHGSSSGHPQREHLGSLASPGTDPRGKEETGSCPMAGKRGPWASQLGTSANKGFN